MTNTINLNDLVKIKPLRRGLQIMEKELRQLRESTPHLTWEDYWKPDKNGYVSLPLWKVMRLFGAATDMESELPIAATIGLLEVK